MKKGIIIFLLASHLFLFFMGTSFFNFDRVPEKLQALVIYYLSITGGHSYNFFSPDIPQQVLVTCTVTDSNGSLFDSHGKFHMEHFGSTENTYELRSDYFFQSISNNGDYEAAGEVAIHHCLKKYPKAKAIEVVFSRYSAPDIVDFKEGHGRGSLNHFYTKNYTRE